MKQTTLRVRLDASTAQKIEQLVNQGYGVSMSDVVRRAIREAVG